MSAMLGLAAASLITLGPPPAPIPWPVEGQDRSGTGRALGGIAPEDYTTPWIEKTLGNNEIITHGPSLGRNGVGYYGTWVSNLLVPFNMQTYETYGGFSASNFVACTPAITDDAVTGYKAIVISTTPQYPNSVGKVFSLNPANQLIRWSKTTGVISGSPILGPEGDVAVAPKSPSTLKRYKGTTGAEVWSAALTGTPRGRVVFSPDGTVAYIAHDKYISAYRWSDGVRLARITYSAIAGAPSVAPNGYVVCGTEDGFITVVNATLSPVWSQETSAPVVAPPAFMTNGDLVIGGQDRTLYCFNTATGDYRWSVILSQPVNVQPLIGHDDRVYVQLRSGDTYAISPTGVPIWQKRIGGDTRGAMSMGADGRLYVGYVDDSVQRHGCAVIRQSAEPAAVLISRASKGTTTTGDDASLVSVDGNYYEITSPQNGPSGISAEFSARSNRNSLAKLTLRIASKVVGDGATQCIRLYDYRADTWVPISVRATEDGAATITDAIPGGDTSRFAHPVDKSMRVFINWVRKNTASTSEWKAQVDQANLKLVPNW